MATRICTRLTSRPGQVALNALRRVHAGWMRLALLLNRLTTPLIAAMVYFLVMTPAGWIMRAAGTDPMRRRFDPGAASYRVPSRKAQSADMQRPF